MKRYILIGAAALALLFTGCTGSFIDPGWEFAAGGNGSGVNGGNGGGTSFNPNIDSKIVGKWYNEDGTNYCEFKANGTWYSSGGGQGQSGTFTAKNSVLTLTATLNGQTATMIYSYTINGNKLTIINQDYPDESTVLYKSGKNNGGNSGGDVSGSIVGKWQRYINDENRYQIIEFKANGQFEVSFSSGGGGGGTGTYTAKDGVLTLYDEEGEPHQTVSYSIGNAGNTLTIGFQDGSEGTYTRR